MFLVRTAAAAFSRLLDALLPPRRGFALALLFAAGLFAPGCPRARPPDILLIVIDTLRADKLSAYGEQRDFTPFLDSLAARGTVFLNAYAPSSWTSPSIASLFTSRFQSQHRILTFGSILADGEQTLAEVLRAKGYATGGFSANYLLDARHGYGQGFERYQVFAEPETDASGHVHFGKARAAKLEDAAVKWLEEVRKARPNSPVFLYLHYMEPHNPYEPEPEFLQRVLEGRDIPDRERVNRRMLVANVGEFSDDMLQAVRDYYDAEVLSIDASLRRLFATFERRGLLRGAITVVTADHGEEHREHGHVGHGQTLFEEVIRIPLIILPPGTDRHREVSAVVSLVDVAPTLLAAAGIGSATPAAFVGHSLAGDVGSTASWWGGEPRRDPFVYSELLQTESERSTPHERAVVGNRHKLIANAGGREEFFDLAADPGETRPGALTKQERKPLRDALQDFIARFDAGDASAAPTLSPETIERMRALGYRPDPAQGGAAGASP